MDFSTGGASSGGAPLGGGMLSGGMRGGMEAPRGGMAGMAGARGEELYGPPRGMAGYGEGMAGMRPPTAIEMPGAASAWEKSSMDIPIEIQGIICIYNPPDINKLGKGTAGETPAANSPTPPAGAPAESL